MAGIVKRVAFIGQSLPANQVALTDGQNELIYSKLVSNINECSQWLSSLNSKVIALHGQNSIDWVVLDLACQEIDIVCVPLPTFFTADQIRRCMSQAGVDIVISDQQNFDSYINANTNYEKISLDSIGNWSSFHVWQYSNADSGSYPDTTQKITFTSGSTGSPKGVCLSESHQWQVAQSLADRIGVKYPKHLCLLPLSTLLENIAGVYAPLLSGGSVVLPNDDTRGIKGSSGLDVMQLLACIDRIQPTTIILIPQLLSVLVAACKQGWRPPGSLSFVAVGGGKVSADLITMAHHYHLPVYQGYGLSECGSVVALNTQKYQRIKSVGKILPHCKVSIEQSEILVSGASHLGYLGDPDSWYPDTIRTGDIGTISGDYLSIEGRQKNILITSFGRNISPEWVESELNSMPLLSQCMVVGDGKAYLSALISAPAIVTDTDIEQWIQYVNERLPDYARVLKWQRIAEHELKEHSTANGRLQREHVEQVFSKQIEQLYLAASG